MDDQFENIMQPKMIKRKSLNDEEEEEAEEYKRKKEKRKERKSKITAQC